MNFTWQVIKSWSIIISVLGITIAVLIFAADQVGNRKNSITEPKYTIKLLCKDTALYVDGYREEVGKEAVVEILPTSTGFSIYRKNHRNGIEEVHIANVPCILTKTIKNFKRKG